MNRENQNVGDLRNKKIGRLLAKLAIPTTIAMIANSLYNIVDTIFIGKGVGTLAIAGIGIVFPIQMIVMSLAQLIGLGSASMISRYLGRKDYKNAANVAGNSFLSIAILGIAVSAVVFIFMGPILKLFGASENILPYAGQYLSIIVFGFIYFPFMVSTNNIIRAEGDARNSMLIMLLATGLNIVLDPIFIFGFNMGIRGAAYATIISQFAGFIFAVSYYLRGKSILPVKINCFKLKFSIIKEMTGLGFASFIRQVSASFLIIIVNNSLNLYGGDIFIAAYAVVNRIFIFTAMPLFGVVAGVQPIIGYNHGADNTKRVRQALKVSILSTVAVGSFSFLIFMIFPSHIISIFSNDSELISIAVFPLRMITLLFPFLGSQFIGAGFFQSIGKAAPSIILSMSRQILFLIPLILLMPLLLGINGIWISFPIADILAIILTGIFLYRELKRIGRPDKMDPLCQNT